jgi:hypothetical protein
MIKKTIFHGIFLLFWIPASLLAGAGPRISCAVLEHDFGDVIHGESPSAELTCTNTGDDVLILERTESSCGCARAIQESQRLAPGSSGVIHAQIDTFGMRPGQQFKTIDIHSNDPQRPKISIKLIFNVVRHLSLDPLTVAMRLPDCDKDAVFPLTANNYWTKPIALKAARSSSSDEVVLVPQEVVVPPGGKADFQLSVRVKRRSGQSHLKGTALIETNDPVEKILPIRYFIQLPKTGGS